MKRLSAFSCVGFVLLSAGAFAQVPAPLRPYVACHFEDGLAVIEKEPTPPAASGRTAITLLGPKQVPITRGERLLFAYPDKSPFVRATIEQIPLKAYVQGKADLISAFDKLIAPDDNVQRNYMLKPQINGFAAEGFDKKELGGNVLGSYLLIDDATRSVVSIDFLNQPVDERSFSSLDEYTKLRDGFLAGYTACVRANLRAGTPATAAGAAKKAEPARKPAKRN